MQEYVNNLLLECTGKPRIAALVDWLNGTDFFTAPASTKYHGCHEGGLAEHSHNVYTLLARKSRMVDGLTEESARICGLLHDVCKIGVYKKSWKNVKKYCEDGSKRDEGGRFDWVTEEGYIFEDDMPLGHGAKSLFLIREFIELSNMEAAMILHHMGAFPGGDAGRDFSAAANKWPAVALMHTADVEASYCLEAKGAIAK